MMSKFSKIFKIVLSCLILGGFISLALCYMIIPERTKQAVDVVVGYLNTPLGIAGGSLTIGGIISYILIKYGVIAQKTKIKEMLNQAKSYVENVKDQAKDYEQKGHEYLDKAQVVLKGYESELNTYYDYLLQVCETSPNAKIKALGEQIKKRKGEFDKELTEKQELVKEIYSQSKESATSKYLELESKYNELLDRVERLVEQYGEREETIDCDTKEE